MYKIQIVQGIKNRDGGHRARFLGSIDFADHKPCMRAWESVKGHKFDAIKVAEMFGAVLSYGDTVEVSRFIHGALDECFTVSVIKEN